MKQNRIRGHEPDKALRLINLMIININCKNTIFFPTHNKNKCLLLYKRTGEMGLEFKSFVGILNG